MLIGDAGGAVDVIPRRTLAPPRRTIFYTNGVLARARVFAASGGATPVDARRGIRLVHRTRISAPIWISARRGVGTLAGTAPGVPGVRSRDDDVFGLIALAATQARDDHRERHQEPQL
jgi:hypothetical protein